MKEKNGKTVSVDYKIEKGVSMDANKSHKTKYPFDKMEVGDSFLISKTDKTPQAASLLIYAAAKRFNTLNGKSYKIATRRTEEGLRIWRVL